MKKSLLLGPQQAWRTSPACPFVNVPLYETKKQAPLCDKKNRTGPTHPPSARARAAPLLKAPQCRSKILLLMAARAAVATTAAASNDTAALANANIPTAHRHKRTHERHKQTTARAQAQHKRTSNQHHHSNVLRSRILTWSRSSSISTACNCDLYSCSVLPI